MVDDKDVDEEALHHLFNELDEVTTARLLLRYCVFETTTRLLLHHYYTTTRIIVLDYY